MRTKKEEKKEFDLQEACVLWLHTSKNGKEYLKGHDLNRNNVVGYFNIKENEKQPTIRVYSLDKENKIDSEIITLWETESLNKSTYLSGYTDENEKVIAFYGNKEDLNRPYIRVYFKDEN